MKAILVIDMPKSCADCELADFGKCWGTSSYIPVTCPLKPLPPKLDANDWHRMFSGLFSEREAKGHGWNACLKEITGE